MGAWWDIPGDTPGVLFESYTPSVTFETFFVLFQSTMNLNFVETHVFTKLYGHASRTGPLLHREASLQ